MENWINILGLLLSIVTASGNGFVIFLVTKTRRLHSAANWFILSLAVADGAVGVVIFPSRYFCNNPMACNSRVYMAFYWFLLHSSVTNLCILTWDRYIAMVHRFKYNTSTTKRRPGMVILIAWLIPSAIALSLFVGMYATASKTAQKVLQLTGVSAFNMVSCWLLFYAVIRILVVARAQSHNKSAIEQQVQQSNNQSSNSFIKDTTSPRSTIKCNTPRFIIAAVIFFLGCHRAVNCLIFCFTFSCGVPEKASQVVTFFLVVNSAVNPLVYARAFKEWH